MLTDVLLFVVYVLFIFGFAALGGLIGGYLGDRFTSWRRRR